MVIAFQNVDSNAGRFKNRVGNSLVSEGKSEEGMDNALRKTIYVCVCIAYGRTNACGRVGQCCSVGPRECGLWA